MGMYGTLCCFSYLESNAGERDMQLLRAFAEILADRIEEQAAEEQVKARLVGEVRSAWRTVIRGWFSSRSAVCVTRPSAALRAFRVLMSSPGMRRIIGSMWQTRQVWALIWSCALFQGAASAGAAARQQQRKCQLLATIAAEQQIPSTT
jgi:hypothetical protein